MEVKGSKNSYEDFSSEIMAQWQASRLRTVMKTLVQKYLLSSKLTDYKLV